MALRLRLLIALLVAVVAGLVIVDILTYTLVTREQIDQVDQELQRAHPPIERAADGEPDEREAAIRAAAPGFYAELRSPDGTTLLAVPLERPGEDPVDLVGVDLPGPANDLTDDEAVFTTVSVGDEPDLRLRIARQSDDNVLVVGRSLAGIHETRERLLAVLLAATVGAVVVVGMLGTWLVRVGLRPLTAVERAAGRITDSDLERRVPGADDTTEVGQLATTINRMLDRLEAAFVQRTEDLATLQESEARMRRFVADASHELRTPIAATAAYAELFERGARDRPDDLERAMAGIRTETARMSELVEDLLLLSQLDEGRPLDEQEVDLADLVIAAVDAAATVAPDRPVDVRIDEVVTVVGDEGRLRQVLDNLLGNVRVHTPAGTACSVELGSDAGCAVVTVADDGPGMPAADAMRAFDRFHRADDSRTRASGGAGLGLSIVAAIVAAHDGTATMTSAPGAGARVEVRLPLAPTAEPPDGRSDGPAPHPARDTDDTHEDVHDRRDEREVHDEGAAP